MDSNGQFRIAASGDLVSTGNTFFIGTADKVITNTITETSVVPTGGGSAIISKTFWAAGRGLRVRVSGVYSTPAVVASSVLLKIKLGSTVVSSGTTTALATGSTNLRFDGTAIIVCRTAGASGVLSIDSGILYNVTGSDIPISDPLNNSGATITGIDLSTADLLFDITATWDTATTTRSAKITTLIIEPLW